MSPRWPTKGEIQKSDEDKDDGDGDDSGDISNNDNGKAFIFWKKISGMIHITDTSSSSAITHHVLPFEIPTPDVYFPLQALAPILHNN